MARLLRLLISITAVVVITTPTASSAAPTPVAVSSDLLVTDISVSPEAPAVGDVVVVRFTILDQDDQPVTGLQISASLRASSDARDVEPPDPIITANGHALPQSGHYEASLAVNQTGNWWIEIEAREVTTSRMARLNRFINVDPTRVPVAAPVRNPIFFQGDAWGSYYRLDPATGSVARLSGHSVVHAGERWFMVSTILTPVGRVSSDYGGVWRVKIALTDGSTGQAAGTVDLGEIRASVYVGSSDQPAIATAITIDPSGESAYVYWARQLGQGWLAWVVRANTSSGEIQAQRMLQGAIGADSAWARLDLTNDANALVVSEQIVRSAQVTGYRLTTLDPQTLEPTSENRRTESADDPLARCLLATPGPTGAIAGEAPLRYSLCTPSRDSRQPALVTWDPLTGTVVRQIVLATLAGTSPDAIAGVASSDGRRFYAVNTVTRQIIEIDLRSATLLRRVSFAPVEQIQSTPSTWDRLRDWVVSKLSPDASAAILVEPGIAIAPDGSALYLVSPASAQTRGAGDGIWVIDTTTLQVTQHLLAGQSISGIVVAPDGQLAVVRRSSDSDGDNLSIVRPDGKTTISLTLPDQSNPTSASR